MRNVKGRARNSFLKIPGNAVCYPVVARSPQLMMKSVTSGPSFFSNPHFPQFFMHEVSQMKSYINLIGYCERIYMYYTNVTSGPSQASTYFVCFSGWFGVHVDDACLDNGVCSCVWIHLFNLRKFFHIHNILMHARQSSLWILATQFLMFPQDRMLSQPKR